MAITLKTMSGKKHKLFVCSINLDTSELIPVTSIDDISPDKYYMIRIEKD